MPTYVYECQRCGDRFELLQGINDPPRQRCPKCRGKVKRVLLPGGGFVFKGSGFYITDYKRKEERAAQGSSDKTGTGGVSAGEDKAGGASEKGTGAKDGAGA